VTAASCQYAVDGVGNGVAASLHGVDCAAGQMAEAAFGRLFGTHGALEFMPDVAFVDLGLPGIDGYEVARRLRAVEGGGHIFLVALTGYGAEEDRRAALEAGFDAHATKPVEPERLAALIAQGAVAARPAAE